MQFVSYIITFVFSLIVYFLSKLLVMLTGVLIVFARYNKFNMAPPVQVGWVIVRDIMNMLFVVALLASAFATIIGRGEAWGLHYKKVVPGLVVGIVLVNFSRTFMLLMIDASQVAMLTFIAAFEGTIAGNIFQAFGLTNITQLRSGVGLGGGETSAASTATSAIQAATSPVGAAVGAAGSAVGEAVVREARGAGALALDTAEIIVSYMLGIFLLVTAVSIILIYTVYFIARIIGLWLLIIISPVYFGLKSLPAKIGGSLGGMTKDVEGKFASLIIGGPKIAFFLWLAFAIVQQTAGNGGLGGPGMGFDQTEQSVTGFVTIIGTVQELAGFIVAAAILSAGFAATKSTANDLGLQDVTGFIGKQKDKYSTMLTRAPWNMTKSGVGYVNRRFGLTNQVAQGLARGASGQRIQNGTALQNMGGGIGSALSKIPGFGGALAAGAAATAGAVGAKAIADNRKEAKAKIDGLSGLPVADRVAAMKAMNSDMAVSREQYEANHDELMKADSRKAAMKMHEDQEKARLFGEIGGENAASAQQKKEIGAQAKAFAAQQIQEDERTRLAQLESFAKTANDRDAIDKVKKQMEKSLNFPATPEGAKAFEGAVRDAISDPSKFGEMDKDVLKSGALSVQMLRERGVLTENKDGTATVDQSRFDALKEIVKDNKELVKTLDETKRVLDGKGKVAEVASARRQKGAYGEERFYGNVSRTQADGTAKVELAAVFSANESAAKSALESSGVRAKGADFSTWQKAAVDAAIPELPMEQIMKMMDVDGDGATLKYMSQHVSMMMADTSKTISEKLERVGEIIRAAKAQNASTEQMANLFISAVPADADARKDFMWQVSSLSRERQLDLGDVLSVGAAVESKDARVGAVMSQIKSDIFTEGKVNVPTGRMRKVQEKTGRRVPKKDAAGKPMVVPDGSGRFIEEDEVIEKEVPEEKERYTPSMYRNILYRSDR